MRSPLGENTGSLSCEGVLGVSGTTFLPPTRCLHTEHYDAGNTGQGESGGPAIITTTFVEEDGRTTMTSVMDFGSKKSRDEAMLTGMTDGMEQSYQLLDGVRREEHARQA